MEADIALQLFAPQRHRGLGFRGLGFKSLVVCNLFPLGLCYFEGIREDPAYAKYQ